VKWNERTICDPKEKAFLFLTMYWRALRDWQRICKSNCLYLIKEYPKSVVEG